MPKIQGTNRTVQTHTERLTPPSTAGFGASGQATEQFGNVITKAGNDIADILGAQEEKNQEADFKSDFYKLQKETDDQLFDFNKTYNGDGNGYISGSGKIFDKNAEGFTNKYANNPKLAKRALNLADGARVQYNRKSLTKGGAIQHNRAILKSAEIGANLRGSLVTEENLKVHGFGVVQEATNKYFKIVDGMALSPSAKRVVKEKWLKDTADYVANKVDPVKLKEMETAYDKGEKSRSVVGYSRDLEKFKVANRSDGKKVDVAELKPVMREKLSQLQQRVGKQLTINSGYRDSQYNAKVGGSKNSRHMHRDAVDLQWPKGASIEEKQQIIAHAVSLDFKGFGIGDGILHLDMGGGRFWGYKNGKPTGSIPQWAVAALSGKVKAKNINNGQFNGAPDYRGQKGPAAIRYNNPGAQWPGASAKKFGMTHSVTLKDGQNNQIAVFPTMIHGAAAQLDLLNNNYTEMTLASAIKKWSGGNNWESYVDSVVKKTGLKPNTVLTKEMLQNPEIAIPLTKAMSQHEVGRKGVMSNQHWVQAHNFFMNGGKGDVASFAQRQGSKDLFLEQLFSKKNRKIVQDRHEQQKENAFISGVVSGEIRVTGNDTEAMKVMNKAFNREFGPDTDFLRDEKASEFALNLSKNKTVLPKRWFQKMEGYLASDNPDDRELAFQLMDKVQANNPENFSTGVGAQNLHKKLDQFRFLSEYYGPKGAVNQMMIAEERLSKMKTEELKTEKNKFIKELNSEETLLDAFDDNIDFWPGGILGGIDQDPTLGISEAQKLQIMSEYKGLAISEFEKTGNRDLAKASALHMIKKRYGVTEFSFATAGQRSVMKYPPESFLDKDDVPFAREQFLEDSKEVVAKWSKILAKQGIKVIGEPILISDEHTRRGYEEWLAGKKSPENISLMSGLSMIDDTRDLPQWRFALKVEISGETGYRLVDDYFAIDGLGQRAHERLEHDLLTNKAIGELVKEGKYSPNDPANFLRGLFNYEPRELVNKRKEMLKRK